MYKWKKGDGKTMVALVVACVIGSVAGFIWGICDLPSIDDIFKRAAEFALIFIFLVIDIQECYQPIALDIRRKMTC